MSREVHVTAAQIDAAKLIIKRDQANGRVTSEAIKRIAEAKPKVVYIRPTANQTSARFGTVPYDEGKEYVLATPGGQRSVRRPIFRFAGKEHLVTPAGSRRPVRRPLFRFASVRAVVPPEGHQSSGGADDQPGALSSLG